MRAGLFTIKKINEIPFISNLIKKHIKKIKNYRKEIVISQIVRDLINLMVVDVIETSSKRILKYKPKSIKDIYKQTSTIVDFSENMKNTDAQIKDFLKRNMYNHKSVIINTNKGKIIIKNLFESLLKNPKKYISRDSFNKKIKERVVADFIAGMTDRYAINLHNKIK